MQNNNTTTSTACSAKKNASTAAKIITIPSNLLMNIINSSPNQNANYFNQTMHSTCKGDASSMLDPCDIVKSKLPPLKNVNNNHIKIYTIKNKDGTYKCYRSKLTNKNLKPEQNPFMNTSSPEKITTGQSGISNITLSNLLSESKKMLLPIKIISRKDHASSDMLQSSNVLINANSASLVSTVSLGSGYGIHHPSTVATATHQIQTLQASVSNNSTESHSGNNFACEHQNRKRLKTDNTSNDLSVVENSSVNNCKINSKKIFILPINVFDKSNNFRKTESSSKCTTISNLVNVSNKCTLKNSMHGENDQSLPFSELCLNSSLENSLSSEYSPNVPNDINASSRLKLSEFVVGGILGKSYNVAAEVDSTSDLQTTVQATADLTEQQLHKCQQKHETEQKHKQQHGGDMTAAARGKSWLSARAGNSSSSKTSAGNRSSSSCHNHNTGMWSTSEIEQLRDNVTQYCTAHQVEDPSSVIFGMSKVERSGFYKDIAAGINRPLFSVYRKVIRMYDFRNYLGRYSREELDKLKTLHSTHGNNWQAIGASMGRSSASVKDRCRLLSASSCRRGAWTPDEEDSLATAVRHQMDRSGSSSSAAVSWSAVAAAVGTRTDKQCRAKWLHYLSWKRTSGVHWSKADELQLICRLSVCGVSDEGSVDWAALARGWPAVRSPNWLRNKWWNLKHKLNSNKHDTSLRENCRLLYSNVPASILKTTLIEVPTATASSGAADGRCQDQTATEGEDNSLIDLTASAAGSQKSPSNPSHNIRLAIPAANFSDLINIDAQEEMQERQQKLIESAVVITEAAANCSNTRIHYNTHMHHNTYHYSHNTSNTDINLTSATTIELSNDSNLSAAGSISVGSGIKDEDSREDDDSEEQQHSQTLMYDDGDCISDVDDVVIAGDSCCEIAASAETSANSGICSIVNGEDGGLFCIGGEVCIIGSEICSGNTNNTDIGDINFVSSDDSIVTNNLNNNSNNNTTTDIDRRNNRSSNSTEISSGGELCLELDELRRAAARNSVMVAAQDPMLTASGELHDQARSRASASDE